MGIEDGLFDRAFDAVFAVLWDEGRPEWALSVVIGNDEVKSFKIEVVKGLIA